jgi:hypothetical protein
MNELLASVKQNNEDFEWYPTKEEMLIPIYIDIISNRVRDGGFSLLDIGAGDGRIFTLLESINKKTPLYEQWDIKRIQESFHIKKYAIEKSKILISAMDKDVVIVGTDFTQQSLIDKKVDYIFCNPPYSEYVDWSCKILKEANCETIYMIIPKRWKDNDLLTKIIDKRKITTTILGSYNFLNAERQARAVVDVVKFELGYYKNNSFDIWFDEHFKINASQSDTSGYYKEKSKKENLNQLVDTNNFIFSIVELYNVDLQKLLSNYKAVESLDASILNELGVNIEGLKEGLKSKITGLKTTYWKIIFERFDKIRERLTSKSAEKLFKKLSDNVNIDITEDNIYSIVIWVLKNSNSYFDEQLLEVYLDLTDKDNIINYKSNKRVVTDDWRFCRREYSHYTLDYRIVVSSWNTFGGYDYEKIHGLNKNAYDKIVDVCVIAKNLGFDIDLKQLDLITWKRGISYSIKYNNDSVFTEIRVYKNGNIHFKFDVKFMKKLNIEASRLNGWIKSAKEATEEFDVTEDEAQTMFGGNLQIDVKNTKLLIA